MHDKKASWPRDEKGEQDRGSRCSSSALCPARRRKRASRDAPRPRGVVEAIGRGVVVGSEGAVLGVLEKLLATDHRQLQRDAEVVLLAVQLTSVGLTKLRGANERRDMSLNAWPLGQFLPLETSCCAVSGVDALPQRS